ncbi:MAG: hypothetical protein N4A38_04975 [Candidatus Gracilibacteria bacterium]|nr:hypothetical protein [Candidatus Gracilibacteria bacterium]
MNKTIRTYRIRLIFPGNIENFDNSFLSSNSNKNSYSLEYKGHKTDFKKRNNRDFLITSDDYNSEGLAIYSGLHRIQKGTQIEILEDSNFKTFDSHYIPKNVEFLVFPKKQIFFTLANKEVFKHVISGIENKYNCKISAEKIDLRDLAQNENNVIGVNIKPNTAHCDTMVGYGNKVNNDNQIKNKLDDPTSFLSNVMIKHPFNGKEFAVTITHDCGIVIYKWIQDFKEELDLVFNIYNTVMKRYITQS